METTATITMTAEEMKIAFNAVHEQQSNEITAINNAFNTMTPVFGVDQPEGHFDNSRVVRDALIEKVLEKFNPVLNTLTAARAKANQS